MSTEIAHEAIALTSLNLLSIKTWQLRLEYCNVVAVWIQPNLIRLLSQIEVSINSQLWIPNIAVSSASHNATPSSRLERMWKLLFRSERHRGHRQQRRMQWKQQVWGLHPLW